MNKARVRRSEVRMGITIEAEKKRKRSTSEDTESGVVSSHASLVFEADRIVV